MFNTIDADLRRLDRADSPSPVPKMLGNGRYRSNVPVSALAGASIRAAVSALQSLCAAEFGQMPRATIDAAAVDQWCESSVTPLGWSLPSKWDPFARDYRTLDGWIRLHTNATHHRTAALTVLGWPKTPEHAAMEIAKWDGEKLEQEIVQVGGCAAKLRTTQEWLSHPQGQAVGAAPIVNWVKASSQPCRWRPVSSKRPLCGLRVLDVTRVLAGPVATRFLASLGADVLRIDPPHWNEDGNAIEMTVGKTCAGLDLYNKRDRRTFAELIRSADVFVHGLRSDALDRLGFDTNSCRALNPGLITVSLNAYGWTGPWANRRGFDSLVQRSTGLAIKKNGAVTALPYQVLDHTTGYLIAAAVLHALRRQRESGQVLSATLSLARQAKLLADHTYVAETSDQNELISEVCEDNGDIERTDWGELRRRALPYQIEGVETGWDVGAHRLRSDAPIWRQTKETMSCEH